MNYKGRIKTARDKYLSKEEFSSLLKATTASRVNADYWWLIFFLMGNLGLRGGEAVRLRVEHIDTKNCAIRVPTLKQEGKKGEKKGSIKRGQMPVTLIDTPVSQIVMDKVTNYIKSNNRRGWIFPEKDGLHLSEDKMRKAFKFFAHKAKLNPIYSPHSLRHCKGIQTYRKLKDIRAVQAMLRHRNINSTVVYTHLDLDAKRELSDNLEVME